MDLHSSGADGLAWLLLPWPHVGVKFTWAATMPPHTNNRNTASNSDRARSDIGYEGLWEEEYWGWQRWWRRRSMDLWIEIDTKYRRKSDKIWSANGVKRVGGGQRRQWSYGGQTSWEWRPVPRMCWPFISVTLERARLRSRSAQRPHSRLRNPTIAALVLYVYNLNSTCVIATQNARTPHRRAYFTCFRLTIQRCGQVHVTKNFF